MAQELLDDKACRPERCIIAISKEHIRRNCVSTARYRCISTAIKNESECTPGRHSRVDLGGVSIAISEAKHLWRSCISPARYSCISTAINKRKAKPSLDHTAVSTRAVYQLRELFYQHQSKMMQTHFWSTQPCRPWAVYQPRTAKQKHL